MQRIISPVSRRADFAHTVCKIDMVADIITKRLTEKLPEAIRNAKTLLEQRKQYEEDTENEQD